MLRTAGVLTAAALALAVAVVSAQGVTVFTGTVTIDGQPAPAGTQVSVTLQDGTVVGSGFTGSSGLDADQYRIDIQATASLAGQTVNVIVAGASQAAQATEVFSAGRVFSVNVVATASLPAETVLAPLEDTGNLELVSSFNYDTGGYQAYVPNLPGNQLSAILPNTALFITVTQDTVIVVSGVTFTIRAFVPTPVPVGPVVTFDVL